MDMGLLELISLPVILFCAVAVFGTALYLVLGAGRARISMKQGRLQVTEGIFGRQVRSFEIWRASNIELKQTFLQSLTNDGYLKITLVSNETFIMPGIGDFNRMRELQQELLDLNLLLRQHPALKGIYQ